MEALFEPCIDQAPAQTNYCQQQMTKVWQERDEERFEIGPQGK